MQTGPPDRPALLVGGAILALSLFGCSTPSPPVPAAAPTEPHPNSINGQLSRPWHHVGSPVSTQRQAEDEARCKMVAGQTPQIDEIKYYVVYINCLKAAGYQPDPPK